MKKLIRCRGFVGVLGCAMFLLGLWLYNDKSEESLRDLQESLADSIVRFHVISAGDSDEEQSLKLMVKNAVIDMLEEELSDASSKEETLEKLSMLTPEIIALAKATLKENGSDLSVSAAVCDNCFFPIKTYGDLTLPAGEYTAYRIVLGEGEGTNWWCVLYPRLCFVDAAYGVVPEESKEDFKALLDETEYNAIFGKNVKFKFKFLSFLNELFA
ncbi:MAG: stage II sporulation protein R [Lachnospiraceae bacterium]|nr:stage II sporulation protein R [Lachnospiraceae bacterium]